MGDIIITIILVNIEITIIQTIVFEFEDVLYLSSMPKKRKSELWKVAFRNTQNGQKENVPIYIDIQICIRYFFSTRLC